MHAADKNALFLYLTCLSRERTLQDLLAKYSPPRINKFAECVCLSINQLFSVDKNNRTLHPQPHPQFVELKIIKLIPTSLSTVCLRAVQFVLVARQVKMFRVVHLKSTSFPQLCPRNLFRREVNTQSSASIKDQCPVDSQSPSKCPAQKAEEEEFKNARPTSEIPGPTRLPILGIMHHFFPGAKYHNVKMDDLHFHLRNEYGDLVLLPGMMGRPDLVVTYNPDNFAKLYRNEGQWPQRRAFAVFEYFRKNERPDLFKGKAGLLSE